MPELPLPIDELTRKKLVLVRQLYQQAVLQSAARQSVVSRIMAAITYDLTAETLLKAVLSSVRTDKTPGGRLEDILQQVESVIEQTIPNRAQIIRVHRIRNTAQHEARYPNEDDLDECRVYTRDFLEELTQLVWQVPLESVSMTDMIGNDIVRRYLVEAEAALNEHDWEQTVKNANAGLTWALRRARSRFVNEPYVMTSADFSIWQKQSRLRTDNVMGHDRPRDLDPELWSAIQSVYHKALGDIGTVLKELEGMSRAVETDALRAQYAIVEFTLGINRAHYLRFRRIAGDVDFVDKEKGDLRFSRMKSEIDRRDAEFVFDFCVTSVLQIEAQVGDIEKPFGIE